MEDRDNLRYRRRMAYVYILECNNSSYYVGLTQRDHLEERIGEHQSGVFAGYTSLRRPVKLVWAQHFPLIIDAIGFERQIKRWSRLKKGGVDQRRLERSAEPRAATRRPDIEVTARGSRVVASRRAPHHEDVVVFSDS